MKDDDRALIARANRGDREALAELYARHRGFVVALARQMSPQDADALDVLQDVFADFFARFPGFALTGSLRAFLFVAVRNRCISRQRQRGKLAALPNVGPAAPWHAEGAGDFPRLLEALDAAHRDVVMLRFGLDLRLSEIAEALAIPEGTVKSRLHNALKLLRSFLGPES